MSKKKIASARVAQIEWCVQMHLRADLDVRFAREVGCKSNGFAAIIRTRDWGCRRIEPSLEDAIYSAIGAVGSARALERGELAS